MTQTPSLPASIRAHVAACAIDRVTRFFTATLDDTFVELIANARRSDPTRIHVTTEPSPHGGTVVHVTDDGCGIADPSVLLAFGRSGWDRATADREDPAGIGVYALSRSGCCIASRARATSTNIAQGWRAQITPDAFVGKTDAAVFPDEAAPYPHGTSVRFVTEIPAASIGTALRAAALHCPIPVVLNGDTLERKAFLDGAVHAEPWNGIVFGVFRHHAAGYREPDINFHGLTIEARLPTVATIDDGVWAVRADIANAPDLELVLPARKELVETPFAADMREAARHAIYRAMRGADRTPALAYKEYSRARKAGIDMPTAPAVLRPWRPAIADVNDWRDSPKPEPVRPGTIVMAADPDPQDAQALWRAARRASVQHRLFQADSRYDGYSWYDSLAHATDLQFTITRGAVNHPLSVLRGIDTDDVPVIDPGHPESFARPDSIEIVLRIVRRNGAAETIAIAADVAFIAEAWSYFEDVHPLVTAETDLEPHDLADLIHAAYFCPSDDASADSWETQRDRFHDDAMHTAVKLLASEDEARKHTIAQAVWRDIVWVLPKDRTVCITVKDRKVSVDFVPGSETREQVPA